jgi:hypothetical protein
MLLTFPVFRSPPAFSDDVEGSFSDCALSGLVILDLSVHNLYSFSSEEAMEFRTLSA